MNELASHKLLLEEDFLKLPKNANLAFAVLEEKARDRAFKIIAQTDDYNDLNFLVRRTYIATVEALAGRFLSKGIGIKYEGGPFADFFDEFVHRATERSLASRLTSIGAGEAPVSSISQRARARIENAEHAFRKAINESERSEKEKKRLHAKLDELLNSLKGTKPVSASMAFATLAFLLVAVDYSTSILADAPEAARTIRHTVEHVLEEKFAEEEEEQLLIERQRLLAPPDVQEPSTQTMDENSDAPDKHDDNPF